MSGQNILLGIVSVVVIFGLVQSVEERCIKQTEIILKNPDVLLAMVQASARRSWFGSNYMSKLVFGNYDYCTSIDFVREGERILGKFCPFSAIIPTIISNDTKFTDMNTSRFNPLQRLLTPEKAEEIRQIFERSESIPFLEGSTIDLTALSMCVPDACTPGDFVSSLTETIRVLFYGLAVYVDTIGCSTKETLTYISPATTAVATVFSIIFATMVFTTIYHVFLYYRKKEPTDSITRAFSLLYNGRKLIATTDNGVEQILCINGMKVFSMMWIVIYHEFIGYGTMPVQNRHFFDSWADNLYAQYVYAALFAVDTFFFISGLLLAYGYLKVCMDIPIKQQIQRIPSMILHRYIRLTPAIAALYFFGLWIFPHIGTGPLMSGSVSIMSSPCLKYWWRYFLYIQNYYPAEDICYVHTWYLAADMQMFVLSPIVLIPVSLLVKKHFKGVVIGLNVLMVICLLISIGVRYAIPDYANIYDAHSRFSNYLIGILAGIVIRTKRDKKFPFSKLVNLSLWCTSLVVMVALILGQHTIMVYNPDRTTETFFNVLYRPIWCYCLFWIMYSCYSGYGGFANWLLSVPFFQVGSKLSYCMYICHLICITYFVGQTRTEVYFSNYQMYYVWCGHIIATALLGLVWTFAFELPMMTLDKSFSTWLGSSYETMYKWIISKKH